MEDEECHGCGSSLADRQKYAQRNATTDEEPIPTGFSDCPRCGAKKCCMCDMGDDVGCLSCDTDE